MLYILNKGNVNQDKKQFERKGEKDALLMSEILGQSSCLKRLWKMEIEHT